MKPQLLKVPTAPQYSFSFRKDSEPCVNNKWHLHSELELIYIKKGEGTQFIGDSISAFKDGDVILIGPNLPHYWKFADCFFDEKSGLIPDVRVAHFQQNFWGSHFLELPENREIKETLERAKRGLQIEDKAREQVAAILEQLTEAEGSQRILLLMEALVVISSAKSCKELSSVGFKPDTQWEENDRLQAVFEYSAKNFKRKISLEEISEVANISPNSFCRYFKSRTRKTYSRFIIELRIGYACRQLIETSICLKRLCFESGFNNFTSFHKYFKVITGRSPIMYQREFLA